MGAERLYISFVVNIAWFIAGGDGAPPGPADSAGVPLLLLYIVGATERPPDADRGEALEPKDTTAGWTPDWMTGVLQARSTHRGANNYQHMAGEQA